MPRDVNGNYVLPRNWSNDSAGAVEFSPEKFDEQDTDIAAAINDIGDPDALLKWAPEGTNPASVPPGTISEDAEGRPLIKGSGAVWITAVADAVDHAARTDNPHGVTAAQVGLGNVNNTSDADKPISTAQAAALDALGASVASALGTVEAIQSLAGASAFGTLMFANRAELEAALNYTQNTGAWVYGDAIAANNGTYVKDGAAGVGSWTRASDLPFSMIALTVTGGTADAIQAASTLPVPATDRAALLTLVPNASNTGAVTIEINGAAPIAVTDSTGDPLAANALAAGVPVMAMVFAGELRLIGVSDLYAALSAAAAAADAAALSASAAAAAAAADAAAAAGHLDAVTSAAADASDAAIASLAPLLSSAASLTGVFPRVSRAVMKTLVGADVVAAYCTDPGREGVFVWRPDDHSAHMECQSIPVASANVSTDVMTSVLHQMDTGTGVYLKTATADLAAYVLYWVIRDGISTFKLATSFANAKAGVAINITSAAAFTIYRHSDPHEGLYLIPGAKCDGSEGAWVRDVPNGVHDARWWGLDETWAHNQAILTAACSAVNDGARIMLPAGTYPVSRYTQIRWRRNIHIDGHGNKSVLHGNGTPSSVFRVFRSGCIIENVSGGNFSGQVPGELTLSDGNHSESCGVHALALDDGMELETPGGDQNANLVVRNCEFYDLDSGVTVAANWSADLAGGVPSRADLGYYKWSNVWVKDNKMWGIRRQGIEIFLTEHATVTGNQVAMGPKGVGFSTSRAVRLCGCLYWTVSNNIFIGNDELVAGTRGITIEPASMSISDDPSDVRFAGQGLATGNYTENFSEHYAVFGSRGAVRIDSNIAVGDPDARTVAKTATITIASPCVVTIANHYLKNGDEVSFATTGAMPDGMVAGVTYYVRNATTSTFELSVNRLGDVSIGTTGAQSGVHTATIPRASEAPTWFVRNVSSGYAEGNGWSNVTMTIASPCVVTWGAGATLMRVLEDDPVTLWTGGTLPTGLSHGATYYAVNVNAGAGTFQLAKSPGGTPIDTSGTQSGTHHIVDGRWDVSKDVTEELVVSNNTAYSICHFYHGSGRVISQEIRNNRFIGNAATISNFFTWTGVAASAGVTGRERCYQTVIEGNIGITNEVSSTPSINFQTTHAGEVAHVNRNIMSGSSAGVVLSETTAAGTIYADSPTSNARAPIGVWKMHYNPPAYFGVFDLGNYP